MTDPVLIQFVQVPRPLFESTQDTFHQFTFQTIPEDPVKHHWHFRMHRNSIAVLAIAADNGL